MAFSSKASNLVSGDTNNNTDVFVKDTQTGAITRVDVTSAGAQAPRGTDISVAISKTGRYILFASQDTSLSSSLTPGLHFYGIFEHDMQTGTTELVSSGLPAGALPYGFSVSEDGRYVTYLEDANIGADGNNSVDVYLRDTQALTLTDISTLNGGPAAAQSVSGEPVMDCDGSKIVYTLGSNSGPTVEVVDRIGGTQTTAPLSANAGTVKAISCDGNALLLYSLHADQVTTDGGSPHGLVEYNFADGTYTRVSTGLPTASSVYDFASLSGNGTLAVFSSGDGYISGPTDTNGVADIFLSNVKTGSVEIVSMRDATTQTTADSVAPTISEDGSSVAYVSSDSGLVSGDTNGVSDVFVSSSGTNDCSQ